MFPERFLLFGNRFDQSDNGSDGFAAHAFKKNNEKIEKNFI